MSYIAPSITAAGLIVPTYIDIRNKMIADAQSIFGPDLYLEIDSQDYQLISANALMMYDALQSLVLAYNARSPITAIGSALDAIVKLNGIVRKSASYSTCDVTISGVAGTVITNGIVADTNSNLWNLPTTVIIANNGVALVTATSQVIGSITALIGEINTIYTPTNGWNAVTNSSAAIPGLEQETDAQLRSRQAISTAFPSQTMLEGTAAGIASVQNVTRWKVYENDTNVTQVYGADDPGHSITCVVEGGTSEDITAQIFERKGIGCYTNGDQEVELTDAYGLVTTIRFFRPTYIPIDVSVSVTKLAGYTTATTDAIKSSILAYINSLEIGSNLYISAVQYEAMNANALLPKPTFIVTALTIAKHGSTLATNDIVIDFKEVTQCVIGDITVVAT